MNQREVERRLRQHGAVPVGGKKHARWASGDWHCKTTIPRHTGDIPKGTLHAIETDMEHCFGKGWLTR